MVDVGVWFGDAAEFVGDGGVCSTTKRHFTKSLGTVGGGIVGKWLGGLVFG